MSDQNIPLAAGRHYLAIPGPSVMPDRVLNAMHVAAPNIYTGPLLDMMDGLVADLKAVARTKHHVAIYVSNGHGGWEASLANTVAPGEKVLVLVNGMFGQGWANHAMGLGLDVEVMDFGKRAAWDFDKIADRLNTDQGQIKAILCAHVDTSTSYKNDLQHLRQVMDQAGHQALLLADCIASMGCDRFEMDAWGVDVAISSSQKGLMTPPGLGLVWFSDKAAERQKSLKQVSPYWNWAPRANPEGFYQYFNGTAPTHHLLGLREALTMLVHEEGIENAWARHEALARAVWAACDVWGQGGPVEMQVPDAVDRGHAVTGVSIGAPNGTKLRDWLSENLGVTLGIGLGIVPPDDPDWHGHFRIGHMGHVNAHMVLGTLGAIDTGLKALGIPHGDGALTAASRICAGQD